MPSRAPRGTKPRPKAKPVSSPSIVGVWYLELQRWYLVVRERDLWEVIPGVVHYDDAPSPVRAYTLEWQGSEGRLRLHGEPFERHGIVRFDGPSLLVRWGAYLPRGTMPKDFDDERGFLHQYDRVKDEATCARLLEPPLIVPRTVRQHARLGPLRFDRGEWRGRATWHGKKVRLSIERPADLSDADLDRFADALDTIDLAAVRAFATKKLYPLYDGTWRDEQGPDVDEKGFGALLRPETVAFLEDGRACVWFDDGQLFAGHSVTVGLDAAMTPDQAEMCG